MQTEIRPISEVVQRLNEMGLTKNAISEKIGISVWVLNKLLRNKAVTFRGEQGDAVFKLRLLYKETCETLGVLP